MNFNYDLKYVIIDIILINFSLYKKLIVNFIYCTYNNIMHECIIYTVLYTVVHNNVFEQYFRKS